VSDLARHVKLSKRIQPAGEIVLDMMAEAERLIEEDRY